MIMPEGDKEKTFSDDDAKNIHFVFFFANWQKSHHFGCLNLSDKRKKMKRNCRSDIANLEFHTLNHLKEKQNYEANFVSTDSDLGNLIFTLLSIDDCWSK